MPRTFFFDGSGQRGTDASHGSDGMAGIGYGSPGNDGTNARDNATRGEDGAHMTLQLHTVTSSSSEGSSSNNNSGSNVVITVDAHVPQSGRRVYDQNRERHVVSVSELGDVNWSVAAGNGGHGGKGGDGGRGASGYPGANATRYSAGTNGGPGGRGGNGGVGSNGKRGGDGGFLSLALAESETYLLMAVQGVSRSSPPSHRLEAGVGGNAGRNGTGGSGGMGGPGGASFSWTETHYRTEYYTDANGYSHSRMVPYTTFHSNPGGISGPSGLPGYSPTTPLYRGDNGAMGSLEILVRYPDSTHKSYDRRYDLLLQSYATKCTSQLQLSTSTMPCYEFGETLLIHSCSVQNVGMMPTPNQRVVIQLKEEQEGRLELFPHDCFFLPANDPIYPDEQVTAIHDDTPETPGYIRFKVAMPPESINEEQDDYSPIRLKARPVLQAVQLGVEDKARGGRLFAGLAKSLSNRFGNNSGGGAAALPQQLSSFSRAYDGFDESKSEIQLAFPIENAQGILGLHALRHADTTTMSLSLQNTSHGSLGRLSSSGRRVFVNLYLHHKDPRYDVAVQDLIFQSPDRQLISIDPKHAASEPGFYGHFVELDEIPAGDVATIKHHVSFDPNTEAFSTTAVQCDIYLQDIATLHPDGSIEPRHNSMQLIQRRKFEVNCQPTYKRIKGARAIIVTTTSSSKEQVKAWVSVLQDQLNMPTELYSLSSYGHLCATWDVETLLEDTEEGRMEKGTQTLREVFADRLVVVLNEEFSPLRDEKVRPSRLITNLSAFDESTRWLIVGGDYPSIEHLSTLAASTSIPSADTAIAAEKQQKGGGKETVRKSVTAESVRISSHSTAKAFRKSIVELRAEERSQGFDVDNGLHCFVVDVSFRKPQQRQKAKLVEREQKRLGQFLKKKDATRHYSIESKVLDAPKKEGNRWKVGELRVHRGMTRFDNVAVHVQCLRQGGGAKVSSAQVIQSPSMMYAIFAAANMETTLSCYANSLKALSMDDGDYLADQTSRVIQDTLVSDFCYDIANFYDARMIPGKVPERSRTLTALQTHPQLLQLLAASADDSNLRDCLKDRATYLVARFESLADSKDLKRWWNPFSRRHAVRRAFLDSIKHHKASWSDLLISPDQVKAHRKEIELEVKEYIRVEMGLHFQGVHHRYRTAIRYLHSPHNEARYALSHKALRVLRQPEFHRQQDTKSSTAGSSGGGNSGSDDVNKIGKCLPELLGEVESNQIREDYNRRDWLVSTAWRTVVGERDQYLV